MNKIIAVIGMTGCGKSEAVKYFVENVYRRVYFGGVVLDEMKKLGLEINEANERKTREDLRKQFGMGAMAIKSLDKIEEYFKLGNVVIESLYSWEEFKLVKDKYSDSFKLITIFTTKSIRYERLANRKERPLTFQEAISRDYAELENLNKGGPIAFTDYLVTNDSTLKDLQKQLEKYL